LHLDIKPSNILLADDGQPMLLDFHLARGPLFSGGHPPDALGGTRGYMSPEQALAMIALGEGREVPATVDGRSDVYSLGVVLFEALAGFPPPFTKGIAACLLRGNSRIGRGLSQIVGKCLAHDPLDRYADAGALAADLRRLLGDLPLQGVPCRRPSLRWLSAWRRPRG
jgi:serine/threonine protein kinase